MQQLIDKIEQPRNASILKAAYFMRRVRHPLPVTEGYILLKTATEKEPVATKRWFLLQSVRGAAAFRVPDVAPQEGFDTYSAIFDHARQAQQVGASYALHQAINDYVFAVQGRFNDLGLRGDERTRAVLAKAWMAYVATLSEKQEKPVFVALEPMWAQAVQKASVQDVFLPMIEKTLDDPEVPKTYVLLKTAAVVYQPIQPDKALQLLQRAKPLLPLDDLNEVGWFYKTLVDWLASPAETDKGRLAQAIAAQQEMVKLTGRGQAGLLMLYRRSGNEQAVAGVLAALIAPNTNGREINDAAESLIAASHDATPDAKASDLAVTLLSNYLATQRTRDIEQELRARLMLGRVLMGRKKWKEARQTLTAPELKQPLPTPKARMYLAEIKWAKARLEVMAEESNKVDTKKEKH